MAFSEATVDKDAVTQVFSVAAKVTIVISITNIGNLH